jgi:hypothetical protein
MTFTITTLGVTVRNATLSRMTPSTMLTLIYSECTNKLHQAECCYYVCRNPECRYAECRDAESRGVIMRDNYMPETVEVS